MQRRFSYPDGNSDVHRNTDADTYGYVYRDCYFDSHGNTDANSNPEVDAHAQI